MTKSLAKLCQSTSGKALGSVALALGMGYWLTTTADAKSPDFQCDDCLNPPDLETFKARLPSQRVSTQADIAPTQGATAQFAADQAAQPVPSPPLEGEC